MLLGRDSREERATRTTKKQLTKPIRRSEKQFKLVKYKQNYNSNGGKPPSKSFNLMMRQRVE